MFDLTGAWGAQIIGLNIVLGVLGRVLLDEINI